MAFDFKKEYKEFYLPKNKAQIVTMPRMNYIAVRGKGNPNEKGGQYKTAIGVLLYYVGENMDFYRINEEYNQYLQRYEKEIKGSLRFNYMIPVLEECIERLVIKDVEDEKYRLLLNKEYQFCMDNAERIQKKANKIYEMVITNRKQKLTDNSCSFSILEQGYQEYVENVLR